MGPKCPELNGRAVNRSCVGLGRPPSVCMLSVSWRGALACRTVGTEEEVRAQTRSVVLTVVSMDSCTRFDTYRALVK